MAGCPRIGGTLAENFSVKSWDVLLTSGERVQVKTRIVSVPARPGQLQTSPFRSWDFETAAFVLLGADDYSVLRASAVPVPIVRDLARWRQHVNGYVVMMRAALLDHPEAIDVTERLNFAAAGESPREQ